MCLRVLKGLHANVKLVPSAATRHSISGVHYCISCLRNVRMQRATNCLRTPHQSTLRSYCAFKWCMISAFELTHRYRYAMWPDLGIGVIQGAASIVLIVKMTLHTRTHIRAHFVGKTSIHHAIYRQVNVVDNEGCQWVVEVSHGYRDDDNMEMNARNFPRKTRANGHTRFFLEQSMWCRCQIWYLHILWMVITWRVRMSR